MSILMSHAVGGRLIRRSETDGVNRDTLVYGDYKPSVFTTGVLPGSVLAPFNESGTQLTITTPGTVLENLEIWGRININAANVTLRNCLLHGSFIPNPGASAIVDCNSAACVNATIEDCTLLPVVPVRNQDGIVGHEYNAYRNNISGTVDGMGAFNKPGGSVLANVKAYGNFVHHLAYFYPDYLNGVSGAAWHTDGTHNDGMQIQGGTNIHAKGNYFELSAVKEPGGAENPDKPELLDGSQPLQANGSGTIIQKQTDTAPLVNVIVEKNWYWGGLAQINCKPGTYTVRNNRHSRVVYDYGTGGYYIRFDSRATTFVTGILTNTWEDTGALMKEPRMMGIHYNA